MASSRWALRAAATVTTLAFALPFSTGTANADPILVLLQDNHVNATVGVSGNVDMLDVAAGAHVALDTGPGISVMTNGGIQVALGLAAQVDAGVSSRRGRRCRAGNGPRRRSRRGGGRGRGRRGGSRR